MLPIPSHLEKILIPIGDNNNEYSVRGKIKCFCNNENFIVYIFANIENNIPKVRKYGDGWALVIKAICTQCKREYLIFDNSKHGYNGFCCHEGVPVPDNELNLWKCIKCNSDVHSLIVGIDSQGKEDFIEEGLPYSLTECTEDDWVNAFECISIDLICLKCNYKDEHWIAYETM